MSGVGLVYLKAKVQDRRLPTVLYVYNMSWLQWLVPCLLHRWERGNNALCLHKEEDKRIDHTTSQSLNPPSPNNFDVCRYLETAHCSGYSERQWPYTTFSALFTPTWRVVYYKSRKRELEIRLMNESRCDERLKARAHEATCLTYTGLHDKTN